MFTKDIQTTIKPLPQKKNKKNILYIIVFIVLLSTSFLTYYNQKNTQTHKKLQKVAGVSIQSKNTHTKETPPYNQEDFIKNFQNCKPDILNIGYNKIAIYKYEIIGKEGDYCRVKTTLKSNYEPYNNKTMFCTYNTNKDFFLEIKNTNHCHGELLNILK